MNLKESISNKNRDVNILKPNRENNGVEASEENKAFLSIISHNIKNPFGALLGYSDLILNDFHELNDAERINYLNELKNTADHTYKYLDRFFEWIYYKTDKYKANFQRLVLRNLIAKATENVLQKTNDLGEINFDIDPSIKVYADSQSILKMFYYLIENSLQYSAKDVRISILASNFGDFVEVKITDNGIGISEKRMTKLFDISKNIASEQKFIKNSTGMGLILVEQILKINSGFIKINSIEGEGTSVILRIPTIPSNN